VTEPANPLEHVAATGHGGQDPLAAFLTANDALLDRLHAYISRRVPTDRHGAEEAYQDALLAFTVLLDKGCPVDERSQVLFGIAAHKVADYWRAHNRRAGEILTEPSDRSILAKALTTASTSRLESVETWHDIERALAQLTAAQREALFLHFVDQLSQEEAAGAMAITRSALRRLLASARKKIVADGLLDGYDLHRSTQVRTREAQA
jgi:RNA polymerase sigma factor (sigma-70 family)